MRLSAGLVVIATAMIGTPTAGAATLQFANVAAPAVRPYQQWVDRSKVPVVPGEVRVWIGGDGLCSGGPACAAEPNLLLIRSDQKYMSRYALYHELGHLFDYQVMTDFYRSAWMRVMDLRGEWRASPNSPHEKFADIYSLCARRFSIARTYTQADLAYGMRLSPLQFRSACLVIRWAAAGAGMDPWPAGVPPYRPPGLPLKRRQPPPR